jgi:DNA adenine methylase
MAPWIVSHFPEHREYGELFCAASSSFFYKKPAYSEILNDLNKDIINLYRVLQNDAKSARLQKLLFLTPYSREEYNLAFEVSEDQIERARRLLIRSLMSYNATSVCMNNSKSGFRNDGTRAYTTPAHNWASYPAELQFFIDRLRGVVIENLDAFVLIERMSKSKDTLLYLDPPYPQDTRSSSNKHFYEYEMSNEDHTRLVELVLAVKGMVVLSGYATAIYDPLEAAGWRKVEKVFQINYSGKRTECLWLNPACIDKLESKGGQGVFKF